MTVYFWSCLTLTILSVVGKVCSGPNSPPPGSNPAGPTLEKNLSFQSPPDLWKSMCSARALKKLGSAQASSNCFFACTGMAQLITNFHQKYPENDSVTSLHVKCGSLTGGVCKPYFFGFAAICKCTDTQQKEVFLQYCRISIPKTRHVHRLKNLWKKHGSKATDLAKKGGEKMKNRKSGGKKHGGEKEEREEEREEREREEGSSSSSDDDSAKSQITRVESGGGESKGCFGFSFEDLLGGD